MSESDNNINIKICVNCGKPEGEVKFQVYRKICTKCNSKKCNEKIKMEKPSYFREKMKAYYTPHGVIGRPKKINKNI